MLGFDSLDALFVFIFIFTADGRSADRPRVHGGTFGLVSHPVIAPEEIPMPFVLFHPNWSLLASWARDWFRCGLDVGPLTANHHAARARGREDIVTILADDDIIG